MFTKTVNTNKYTLSSSSLSLVSDNDNYTWSVTAIRTAGKETYKTKVAEREFSVLMDDSEEAELNIDNLITF